MTVSRALGAVENEIIYRLEVSSLRMVDEREGKQVRERISLNSGRSVGKVCSPFLLYGHTGSGELVNVRICLVLQENMKEKK
jgi:hypothetical protein